MSVAPRVLSSLALVLTIGCKGKPSEHGHEHADGDHDHAHGEQSREACVAVFEKMARCSDEVLSLARTGPVLGGSPPEVALQGARFMETALSSDVKATCEEGVPNDIARGVECLEQDCRAMARCMMQKVEYPPEAKGADALKCRDGLPALEAKGQGKVLQWCVMADGTPHGLARITSASGETLRETVYERGKPREPLVSPVPGKKLTRWWD